MYRLAVTLLFSGIVLASLLIHITDPPAQHSTATDPCEKAPRVRETNETNDQGAEMRERFDPEDQRPVRSPRAPHGQKVVRLSHQRVEGPRKRLFYVAPDDDDTREMAALVRSFQLLSLAPRSERRPEKSCLKRSATEVTPSSPSSPSSSKKKKKKKKRKKQKKKKHVVFAEMLEYLEIPCVNRELGLQDLGPVDAAGNIEMIDVDWQHSVYLEVSNDPSKNHKRYYKAAILCDWMFE